MTKSIITQIGNVTAEGVVISLNQKTKLKTGVMHSKLFFISWDKIGQALFDNYEDSDDLRTFKELRNENKKEVKNDN